MIPSSAEIHDLEHREGRWYFSAAFTVVLRRHGVVMSRRADTLAFVGRNTPWREHFANRPVVFEGPLHESVARELGISVREHKTEDMEVRSPDGFILARLVFPRQRRAHRERLASLPGDGHAQRWETREFTFQEFHITDDDHPLLLGDVDKGRWRAVAIRRGPALLVGAPIFDLLARYDAMPPYDGGYPGLLDWTDTSELESWLITAASDLAVEYGQTVLRVGRWPHPHTWALTVRHDVDRRLDEPARAQGILRELRYRREIARRLDLYRRRNIASTWFWRSSTVHARTMRKVASRGHEIALHTEADSLVRLRDELDHVEQALGARVRGMSAHGGRGAPGHLGLHHTEWAMGANLDYGERIGGGYHLGPAVVIRDGVPAPAPLMLPGQHIGAERGLGPDDSNAEKATDWLTRVVRYGGHAVVMNHPDIHFETLRALLDSFASQGGWSATLAEVARWGRTVQFTVRTDDGLEFPSSLPYAATLTIGRKDGWSKAILPAGTILVALADDGEVLATNADGERIRLITEPLCID